jgi:NADH:ubiquinone oxidoreductase subunit 3 (subunit A)
MSFAAAALLDFLVIVVAIPAVVLGVAVLLGGRPAWLGRRRAEPGIHGFLMISVLSVLAIALLFLVPFAASFGALRHRESAALGLFLALLVLLGLGYAWRRGVVRWS